MSDLSDPNQSPVPLPPLAALPLNYSTPMAGRPGMITAIGVISIVVGSLGIVTNGLSALYGFGVCMFSQMAKSMPAATVVANAPTTTLSGGTTNSSTNVWVYPTAAGAGMASVAAAQPAAGLAAAGRQVAIGGLTKVRKLSAVRVEQLDTLLSEVGGAIFPEAITAQSVAASVSANGQVSGATDYFILPQGRLEITDYGATFTPASGPSTRLSVGWIFDANGQPILPAARVEAIIQHVGTSPGISLTAAQEAAIRSELRAPGQSLILPAQTASETVAQISTVTAAPDGNVTIVTNPGSSLTVGPGGTVSGKTAAMASPFAGPGGMPQIPLAPPLIALVSSLAEVALAIYLLIIGILVIRQHPRGGMLHRWFAGIKIPLVLLTVAAWGWTANAFMAGLGKASNSGVVMPSDLILRMLIFLGFIAILGMIYPVGLLIALRTRSIREYYAAVR